MANATTITPIQLSYVSGATSNIQLQLNNKLSLFGGSISGDLSVSYNTTLQNVYINGPLAVSSVSSFSGAMTVYNTITTNNNITQTGTTATTNRFIQPRISGDTLGNPNVLKYTQIRYNSGSASGTGNAGLQVIDDVNGSSLTFLPNASGGSYNSIVQTNDRLIMSVFGTGVSSAICLTTYGIWH